MNKFFESSYLTWEINSAKNRKFIQDTFNHLTYLEDNEQNTWKHTETVDYFFQQRPVGGVRPFPLLNLDILNSEFVSILKMFDLKSEEQIEFVGDDEMNKYSQQIQDASCFSNSSFAIFFNLENDKVNHIWFDYEERVFNELERESIGNLLNFIGNKYDLILIDWYEKLIINLNDKNTLVEYLDNTAENNKAFFQNLNKKV